MQEMKLSDERLNRYGTRILTSGMDISAFVANPVMFYNHNREALPIGRWENIRVQEGSLMATPVFDMSDGFAAEISRKLAAGFLNATSVGVLIKKTSKQAEFMIEDQSAATITSCELLEVSVVDVPANAGAVRLYYQDQKDHLIELGSAELETQSIVFLQLLPFG